MLGVEKRYYCGREKVDGGLRNEERTVRGEGKRERVQRGVRGERLKGCGVRKKQGSGEGVCAAP